MRPKLLALIAEDTGQTTPIEGTEFLIGRLPICDLRIDDLAVSGRHCRIVCRGERVELEDLGSTNGTLVNDAPARHLALHDGDRIEVGPQRFRIRIQSRASDGPDDASWLGEVLDARALPRVQHLNDEDELHPESPAARAARAMLERLTARGHAPEPADAPRPVPGAGAPHAASRDPAIPSLNELVAEEEVEAAVPDADSSGVPLIDFPAGARSRLRFGDAAGVTLVHLSRADLANEVEVATVSDQLDALIRAGRSRLVLNCSRARHFSSQAIGTLVQAHKRCGAAGGKLKLCGLRPETDQLLDLMGLKRLFEIHPDDHQALQSPWPTPTEPQPSLAATLVLLGQPAAGRERPAPAADPTRGRPSAASQTGLQVRLEVLVGRARRRWIEINRAHFEIGRDPSCQLRPDSPAISRRHTVIEQRAGRVFVRDLDTTNGTTVNGETLRGTERQVHHGDQLQIGPLLFGFVIQAQPDPGAAAGLEDEVARLLLGEGQAQADQPTVQLDATSVQAARAARAPAGSEPDHHRHDPEALAAAALQRPLARRAVGPRVATRCQVVGAPGHESLVVTILASQLDGEDTVAPVRLDLQRCQQEGLPNRVVLDLAAVTFLSSRAVGLLLTTFQHLDRDGGALRLASVRPEVMPTLEHMRVPRFLDLFPSAEAAWQTPWQ